MNLNYMLQSNLVCQYQHPFGMLMPGRSNVTGNQYRFGFNGKENDNEAKGEGNQLDYGNRIYNSRIGRFLSVDPITSKFPMLTPYQFASNRPIDGSDLDGLEFWKDWLRYLVGPVVLSPKESQEILEGFGQRAWESGKGLYETYKKILENELKRSTTALPGASWLDQQNREYYANMPKPNLQGILDDYANLFSRALNGDNKAAGALVFEAAMLFFPEGELGKTGSFIKSTLKFESRSLIKRTYLGTGGREVIMETFSGLRSDALRLAKELAGEIPADAELMGSKFGPEGVTGYKWRDPNGTYHEIRIDYDPKTGRAHYNWENGKKSGAVDFNATQEQVERIIKNEIIKNE